MRRRQLGHLLAGAGSLLAAPAIARAQGLNGVALVIGNSKYQWEAQLPNVKRDAPDIARSFQTMGLKTELIQDAGRSAMIEAINRFGSGARNADFAAFYFAGHGAWWGRATFFVPVDADLSVPKTDALVAPELARKASASAKYKLRVYDNCRNNPADGWRQQHAEDLSLMRGSDLAKFVSANPSTVVLWSTIPGRIALDGPAGQNSPFAAALLRQFNGESMDLSSLGQKVRRDVAMATRGSQVVVDFTSISEPLSIKGARQGPQTPGGIDSANVIELNKAYAFARENKILLPQGVIAFRPASNAPLQKMVGSFKFREASRNSGSAELLMVVLSADNESKTQILLAGPQHDGWWRFVTGKIVGDRLEFQTYGDLNSPHHSFIWRDSNSGRVTTTWPGLPNARPVNASFERLDG